MWDTLGIIVFLAFIMFLCDGYTVTKTDEHGNVISQTTYTIAGITTKNEKKKKD